MFLAVGFRNLKEMRISCLLIKTANIACFALHTHFKMNMKTELEGTKGKTYHQRN